MKEIIGIIGGAGVAATNKLLELIEIQLTQNGAFRDSHHPEMIVYQATQAPSRSMYLEGKGRSFIKDYVHVAKKLKDAGATKLCMCCNTAHFAIEEIQKKSEIEFINLIEEVVKEVKKTKKTKIGLIASDGCLKGKIYEDYFTKLFPLAEIIYPDINMQKKVTKGICNTKNTLRFADENNPDRPINIFADIQNHLFNNGAELVIMGCTDIRVDFKAKNNRTIDSLEVLAKLILKEGVK